MNVNALSPRSLSTSVLIVGLLTSACASDSAATLSSSSDAGSCEARDTGPATPDAGPNEVEANLAAFDELDFKAFNKQDFALFRTLHCADVVVTNSDGSKTVGIDAHLQAIGYLFSFSPETRIDSHPIALGVKDRTAVTGQIHMHFTQPMPQMDGTFIPPNNKTFDGPMATFARWEGGCIKEEQLFLDSGAMAAAFR
jgi:SnoaL-like domain